MIKIDTVPRAASASVFGGEIRGDSVHLLERRARDMRGAFEDEAALDALDSESVMYRVYSHEPVTVGTQGGLLFGITQIEPGRIGREFYMTKGHYHALRNRAEYYWGAGGDGLLLLFRDGELKVERVSDGSLHYIPGYTAHRLVNVGSDRLTVRACWPSDAGHDYSEILAKGFPALVISEDGQPKVVPNPRYDAA